MVPPLTVSMEEIKRCVETFGELVATEL